MNIYDPIAALLFGRTRMAILATLLEQPARDYYMRELAIEIGMVPGAIQRELKLLVGAGLITRRRRGHQVYFKANADCIAFKELRSLLTKTVGIAGAVRQALSPLASSITYAAIYGSVATGDTTPSSDVDLLIVGDISMEDVIAALHEVENRVGREINPTVYSLDEFAQRLREPHSFLSTILHGPRTDLIGRPGESEELGAGRLDSPGYTKPKPDTSTPGKVSKKPPPRRGTRDKE